MLAGLDSLRTGAVLALNPRYSEAVLSMVHTPKSYTS